MSYLLCLSVLSPALALQYFNTALSLCRLTGVQPSFLLHPSDFLGCEDTPDLSFFPAMKLAREIKLEFLGDVIEALTAKFTVVPLRRHAEEVAPGSRLSVVEANAL
jgi:hypothetical protein